ncbi:hypothetical protein CZ794_12670 [Psychrobacter sp. JB385]|nr:hypothetical protein CZ794_12670 [Psychrobacter sp. JB385]
MILSPNHPTYGYWVRFNVVNWLTHGTKHKSKWVEKSG